MQCFLCRTVTPVSYLVEMHSPAEFSLEGRGMVMTWLSSVTEIMNKVMRGAQKLEQPSFARSQEQEGMFRLRQCHAKDTEL